jgi:dTDP-4-dehydrorhamnose 3,5-epimerase
MQVRNTILPGVIVIELKAFGDNRGFFRELFREDTYEGIGLPKNFVQINHSRSSKNTLRGLHYQRQHPQGKLISVMHGAILDVVADVNPSSPTYGKWIAEEISDKNHHQLYVPPGYAHGFITLTDDMDLLYACTDYYNPQDSFTVNWNDPTLNINWPTKQPNLSESDKNAPFLADLKTEHLPL